MKRRNLPLDDTEYDTLYGILSGEKAFKDWPKKQDSDLRQRVYKKWKSGQYEIRDVHDPMVGNIAPRILNTKTNCIVVKKSDLPSIVQGFFDQSKGDGALK